MPLLTLFWSGWSYASMSARTFISAVVTYLTTRSRPFPSRGVKLSILRRLLADPCVRQPMCATVCPNRDPQAMQPARVCGLTGQVQSSYAVRPSMEFQSITVDGQHRRRSGRHRYRQESMNGAGRARCDGQGAPRAVALRRQRRVRALRRSSLDDARGMDRGRHTATTYDDAGQCSATIRRLLHSNSACSGYLSMHMADIDPQFVISKT